MARSRADIRELDRSNFTPDDRYVLVDAIFDQPHFKTTQVELARRTGIPLRTLRKMASGQQRYLSLNKAEVLCDVLNISLPNKLFTKAETNRRSKVKTRCKRCNCALVHYTQGCIACRKRKNARKARERAKLNSGSDKSHKLL